MKKASSSKGFFITLEGGEGSGKSTLLAQLTDEINKRGYEVVSTREPGGSSLGETVRQWLLHRNGSLHICNEAELLLFLAARAQHIEEVIRPALKAGKVVLCDRFNDSTIAYQGVARGMDLKHVRQLCHLVCQEIEPALTLFLDVDPMQGLLRTKRLTKEHASSGEFDRIEAEKLEFHEKVREAFRAIAKREPFRVYRIDANLPQQHVFKEAVRAIDEMLLLPAQHVKR